MVQGYNGGDGEAELIAAYNKLADDDDADVVKAIKTRYWVRGHIVQIAKARGYTKRLGMKGWCATHLRRSVTDANECLRAWQIRHGFDAAYQWYKTGNSGWVPTKATGPRFAIDLDKAYQDRNKPAMVKLSEETRKKDAAAKIPTAMKQLRRQANDWRTRYDRLKAEHVKWANEMQREPLVLNAIEVEIRREEQAEAPIADNPGFPLSTETSGAAAEDHVTSERDASQDEAHD